MSKQIARRTFLRGGLEPPCLCRCWTECCRCAPRQHRKKPTAAQKIIRPNRMLVCFVPNGMHMPDWTPTCEGAFELPWIMEPLKNVKDNLTVLWVWRSITLLRSGDGGGDGACAFDGDISYRRSRARKPSGADIKAGVSVDRISSTTRWKFDEVSQSLEVGIERGRQAGSCDTGYSLRLFIQHFVALGIHACRQRNQSAV